MDWNAIQAIGTIFGATATFFAALIALYLGLRKPKRTLFISAYFYEKRHVLSGVISPNYLVLASDLKDEQADDRLLGFNVRNDCCEDVVLIGFVDRARFDRSFKTLVKRAKRLKRRSISFSAEHGYLSINLRYGDMPYLLGSPIKIKRGKQKLLCIDYDLLRRTQLSREKSGLFDLRKPLKFFALDIQGTMYKSSFRIPAENFLTEKTCTMRKTHWLD